METGRVLAALSNANGAKDTFYRTNKDVNRQLMYFCDFLPIYRNLLKYICTLLTVLKITIYLELILAHLAPLLANLRSVSTKCSLKHQILGLVL